MTDYLQRLVIPTVRKCGLTPDDILSQSKLQEVVYLLDRAGAPLGYRFKWEVFGPFSKELADEVSHLSRDEIAEATPEQAPIDEAIVKQVKQLMAFRNDVDLEEEEWLRLVIAVDFVEERSPGITIDGNTPAFIRLNYSQDAIRHARDHAAMLMHVLA